MEMNYYLHELGIHADVLEHRDPRPPDAIFISRGTQSSTIAVILKCLPEPPKFISHLIIPDGESGARSDYAMSVGLHSDTHEPTDDVRLKARTISPERYRTLVEGHSSKKIEFAIEQHFAS